MRDIEFYIEKAMNRQRLGSLSKLSKEIGITKNSLSVISRGKTFPTEENMIKLAELAGLPKEEAIIDLNLWRAEKNPEVKKVWSSIAKMTGYLSTVFMLNNIAINNCNSLQSSNTQDYDSLHKIYIMRQI